MFSSKLFTLTLLILVVSCMVKSEAASGNYERVKRQGWLGNILKINCEIN